MENYFSKHRKQIMLVVLGITVFYIGLLAYLFIARKSQTEVNTHKEQAKSEIPSSIEFNPASKEAVTQFVRNPLALTEEYKQQRFSIRYPQSWRVLIVPFQGGEQVMFQDDFFPKKPRLAVEVYDKLVDIAPKVNLYVSEGFTKSQMYLIDQNVTVLNATMPFRMSDGKIVPGPMQQKVIYMPRSNALYAFKYYYDGTKEDSVFETLFRQMIETIQFPK
jgi:hypothetical protein